MEDLTLVVMAAGMGSRFGGLKQITPVDNDGNFLIDYSISDAIKAGFKKVVFIIKEENLNDFKETIGKRIENKIEVSYAFQKLENVPQTRVKPLGTVHAILSAKHEINGPFAIINADDFYGFDAYRVVAEFLNDKNNKNTQVSIPYPFNKVDSKHGFVKRGVLYLEGDNVKDIIECNIGYENDSVIAKPLDGTEAFTIEDNHPVSMNMFGFQKSILNDMQTYFDKFMITNKDNLETCECLIPEFLRSELHSNNLTLKYRLANSDWLGMTYKEDLEEVKNKLNELKSKGEYNIHLW